MALSALDDKATEPAPADLRRVLGEAEPLWNDLVARLADRFGPVTREWTFSGAKYGWSLRLKQRKRTILYLIPQTRAFLVGIVLGDRALAGVRREDLRRETLELMDGARRYAEGTGFRIPVTSLKDCREVEILADAKMAP